MISYNNYINGVINNVEQLVESKVKNILITGHNMAGKTDILVELTKRNFKKVYFIDSVNRCFYKGNSDLEFSRDEHIGKPHNINMRRIYSNYLNKIDTFSSGEINMAPMYSYELFKIYYRNHVSFRRDLKKLLTYFSQDISISIEDEITFRIGKAKIIPSNGHQAILRIFTELYHIHYNYGINIFIIDELDAHLDNSMKRLLINAISEIFNEITLIATVHSLTIFEELVDSKIIALNGKNLAYKVIDSTDLNSFDYINKEVFNSYITNDNKDYMLSQIYNNLRNGLLLTKTERGYIDKINIEKLSTSLEKSKFIEIIEHENYITIEKIYDKVYNEILLTKKEYDYLKKVEELTPREEEKKKIILEVLYD